MQQLSIILQCDTAELTMAARKVGSTAEHTRDMEWSFSVSIGVLSTSYSSCDNIDVHRLLSTLLLVGDGRCARHAKAASWFPCYIMVLLFRLLGELGLIDVIQGSTGRRWS